MSDEKNIDIEHLLPYYTLQEVAIKVGSTEDQLIRAATIGKLFLSVVADGWRIECGGYLDGDGETEIAQNESVEYGTVPIQIKDIRKILKGESVQIEYLERSENSYARIVKGESFPTIGRNDLVVGRAEAHNFLKKFHAQKQHTLNELIVAKTAPQNSTKKVGAVPPVTPTPSTYINKLRRNLLDPAIDKAIKQAGTNEPNSVFLKLKELALAEEHPFNGKVEGSALCYTDINNEPAKLYKSALAKRLKRLSTPSNE